MSNNPIGPSSVSSRRYFLCDEKKNAQQKTKKERNRERNMLIDHYPRICSALERSIPAANVNNFAGFLLSERSFLSREENKKQEFKTKFTRRRGKDELNHFLHKCSALSSD
jgi:hypothetical protein